MNFLGSGSDGFSDIWQGQREGIGSQAGDAEILIDYAVNLFEPVSGCGEPG
jgi:hypothetical protein